jgi:hypothetical protein
MRIAFPAAVAAVLLGVASTAVVAGDDAEAPKPAPSWDGFAKQFDLDRDGRVAWVEYQQVVTGFAVFDANHDGSIEADEFAKAPSGSALLAGLGGFEVPLLSGGVQVKKLDVPLPDDVDGDVESVVLLGGDLGGQAVAVDGTSRAWAALALAGRRANANGDGATTRDEWETFVSGLEVDRQDVLTAKSLRDLLPSAVPAGLEAIVAKALLDADRDGRVTRADLAALFDAADADEDDVVGPKDAPRPTPSDEK